MTEFPAVHNTRPWFCFYSFYCILEGRCRYQCRNWSVGLTLTSWPFCLSRDLGLRSGVLISKKGHLDEQEVVAFELGYHDFSGATSKFLPGSVPTVEPLGPHPSKSLTAGAHEVPPRGHQWLHPPFPSIPSTC